MTNDADQSAGNPEGNFNPDDLDWLAFCYLADELDDAHRADFESRLESDTQAQNSLVDAMRGSQLVFASLNTTSFNDVQDRELVSAAPRVLRNTGFRVRVALGAAAATLFIVCSWSWLAPPAMEIKGLAGNVESEQLASAWADTLAMMPDGDLEDLIEDEYLSGDLDDEEDNWMFVALTDLEDSSEGSESESF